ncbi:heme/hemin ABC transporter substrate-binding protein [Halomonas caseinilytica]|uniref:Iron complex transport system substrate-binding protein n=1 Tax=Halomonas caseinilytica TaxID=438744 RepID=A0A1M6NQQ6_9GAMM|nr:helical backbone metal receptor [Halomonas caseinilytica]SHJ97980.1 iron complex transport system substrate-binding protein [Halomonas caseinilytica]
MTMTRGWVGQAVLLGIWLCMTMPALADDDRWVVLGGDIAETVAALDATDRLVGRDDTSLYPDEVAALPSVGYLRRLSAESVLSLKPDHILASDDAAPAETLDQLRAAGISVEVIESPDTLSSIPGKVKAVAGTLSLDARGRELIASLDHELEALAALPELPATRAMFILSHGGMTPMVAGRDTAAQEMLETVGVENAFSGMEGYKPVGAEALARQAPQLVLISRRGLDALGGEDALWAMPGLDMTPAGRDKRLLVVDDQGLLGFGPRTPSLLLALRERLDALLAGDDTALLEREAPPWT